MSFRIDARAATRRRACPLQVEAMETRALLSTGSSALQTRRHLVEDLISARRSLRAEVITQRHERVRAVHTALENGYVPPPPPTPRTLWSKGSFAYNTVTSGVKMTKASPVLRATVDYAKRIIAPDTLKITGAYIGAAFRGNGKQINELGHTDTAKTVKQEFVNLGNSSNVKKIGRAFDAFGNGVAKQFRRIFGPTKSAPPVPAARKS
jgi:hypothetical protein